MKSVEAMYLIKENVPRVRFDAVTGSPPSTSESIDSDVFDLSSSPQTNNADCGQRLLLAAEKTEKVDTNETAERMGAGIKKRNHSEYTEQKHDDDDDDDDGKHFSQDYNNESSANYEIDNDADDDGGGGCLKVHLSVANREIANGSSPPSSCDSGVVMETPSTTPNDLVVVTALDVNVSQLNRELSNPRN